MDPLKLEGATLGHKHRNYNKIVQECTANQTRDALGDIDYNEDDVNNLVKVDIASANRDVDYILGILKGNDMLYVSRALKRSLWLITDIAFAHIINPEYLHSHLIPNMMAKAANKLMLHIRLNLRDEKRVEDFFNYYEPVDLKTALKWLPHCSSTFMEITVAKYSNEIDSSLLKRLCEKSHHILEVYVRTVKNWGRIRNGFQATMFLLNTHLDFYLNAIETQAKKQKHELPLFNAKFTKLLMKTSPERIYQNFCNYANNIHIPTFVKFLDENKVKTFLLSHVDIQNPDWIDFDNVQHFLKRMPQEERVNFIRDIFVNKCFVPQNEIVDNDFSSDADVDEPKDDGNTGIRLLYKYVHRSCSGDTSDLLNWCKCLPFDVILTEFKEKINNTTDDYDRNYMFRRLTQVVDNDLRHLETLLQYYNDNHLKDSKDNKVEFVHNLLHRPTNILSYDSKCWGLLMNIFNAIDINIEESEGKGFDNDDQIIIRAIIIHEVTNKRDVPETISKRFSFYTFKEYQKKMAVQEQTLLFDYLYKYLSKKIEEQTFDDIPCFDKNVELIELMLRLLNDWQKHLPNYPYVLKKIYELIKVKRENTVEAKLSWIYDVNKRWRKCMFEESILLCESDRVCVNALKHDPSLLSRYENVVASMRCNDAVSLQQCLTKLRIYWADTIASEWSQSYRGRLTQPLGHKALMRGLSFLLPEREMSIIINEYKPEDANINWEKNDEVLVSLRKHIAKNMHFARPQPTPNDILLYAKGDYLQFALPSLNAILYNLRLVRCNELIPKLLDSPVSLQKHGIRFAFAKMPSEDLQRIFSEHWKTIKNLSIRAVTFKLTYEMLCKEKSISKIEDIWGLLSVFIDGLTFEEDKTIYELLGKARNVPVSVRPAFVMRSYKFVKALLPKSDLDKNKYEQTLNGLVSEMENLIDAMEPEFITAILREYITVVYTKEQTDEFVHNNLMPLLAVFLCRSASIEIQAQRYETVLLLLLNHSVAVWATKDKNSIVKTNLKQLLSILRGQIRPLVEKDKIVPVAMFANIQKELEKSLDHNVAYLTLREWKLTVAFTQLVQDSKMKVDRSNYSEENDFWIAICKEVAPQFGKICLDFLREDIRAYFPSIDEYFTKALGVVLDDLIPNQEVRLEILKHMLTEDLTQSYLVSIRILPSYYVDCKEDPLLKFHKTILSHPSLEVKMHFYHKNKHFRHMNL
ncbi:uncharacterized protein LOC125236573 [Leguminivora glycinivorella]|uniref:uncharacterized protein LOC125236573 n=1 Tax=Leguminivora glycinivorella TaxID=1035111 RepID=UPI00200EEC9D|nr:uncharacterized protein LOC125236573 [Leguminivora glycinivorella]